MEKVSQGFVEITDCHEQDLWIKKETTSSKFHKWIIQAGNNESTSSISFSHPRSTQPHWMS
jgi:hypothetical protein